MKILQQGPKTYNYAEFWEQLWPGFFAWTETLEMIPTTQWPKEFSVARIHDKDDIDLPTVFRQVPQEILYLHSCDSAFFDGRIWWPQWILAESFNDLIMLNSPAMDTHGICYVAGSGVWARLAAHAAVHLGFKKIHLITNDKEAFENLASDLQKRYFGVEWLRIGIGELTLKPNSGTLLINTSVGDEESSLREDLIYLNFLKPKSLVVDFDFMDSQQLLIKEAKDLGGPGLDGLDIFGFRDYLFLKKVKKDLNMSTTEYLRRWREFSSPKAST